MILALVALAVISSLMILAKIIRAKLLMMQQSTISVLPLVVVASRAINIPGN